jgi:hypothetical protein
LTSLGVGLLEGFAKRNVPSGYVLRSNPTAVVFAAINVCRQAVIIPRLRNALLGPLVREASAIIECRRQSEAAVVLCINSGKDAPIVRMPVGYFQSTRRRRVWLPTNLSPGKALALDFADEFLPKDYEDVRDMFGRRGAYRNFRALVTKRRVLERWYDFELKATKRAVREWCELNEIEIID